MIWLLLHSTGIFPKELGGRINRIAAAVHQSREMSWEQQRNGTLGSPDKVYLDQRREIAFSASFASWGLSVIKTNGGPIRTKGFLGYQGWYCRCCCCCHRHSSAQMMHCLRSHRIIIYTLAFMMLSIGGLRRLRRKKTIMVQGSGTWQPWHISSKRTQKRAKDRRCIFSSSSRSARRRHQDPSHHPSSLPFSHACRPPVKPFRGILIKDSISISSKKYI